MSTSGKNCVYKFRGFVLDVGSRRLSDPLGQIVKLGSRSFDLLLVLIQHQGEMVSKKFLLEAVWTDVIVEENNLNQAISLVRKALGDSSSESAFIQTIPGKGFCFVASVEVDEVGRVPAASSEKSLRNLSFYRSNAFFTGMFVCVLLVVFGVFYIYKGQDSASASLAADQVSGYSETAASSQGIDLIPDSIAVMPFVQLNTDLDSELFVVGLHDELINQLAKVKSLKVISRDSVVNLSENAYSTSEIAGILKVESLMTGTVLLQAEMARINLKMLDAKSGVVLWAESYEADAQNLSDMLSLQYQIAQNVVHTLELEIQPPESARMTSMPTKSAEAYKYYLTARNVHRHQEEAEKWLLVNKVLELDPEFSDAHLYFASINSLMSINPMEGLTAEDHLQVMMNSLEKFIKLEPDRTEGYALKAVALGAKHDWIGVAEQIQILNNMNASLAEQKYLAILFLCLGNFDKAIQIYEESLITEPVNLYSRGLLMAALEIKGDQARARKEYALGNDLKSQWWGDTVNVLLALGRGEALEDVDDLVGVSPKLIYTLKNLHKPELVQEAIDDYILMGKTSSQEDAYYSALSAYLGDYRSANILLRMSMENVSTSIFWAWLPVFSELRQTKEFKVLLEDFGLVAYWRKYGWPEVCQPYNDSFACH